MARTSKSRGASPFSMKSGNRTTFKMMGSSPAKRTDIFINDENIGTGNEARKEAERQEKVNKYLEKRGKSRVTKNDKTIEYAKVKYTGKDAIQNILNNPNMSDVDKGTTIRGVEAGFLGTKEHPYTEGTTFLASAIGAPQGTGATDFLGRYKRKK